MKELDNSNDRLLLGYTGLDRDVGEEVLSSSGVSLTGSTNGYDWLGAGIYFWESDPARAALWAVEAEQRHRERYRKFGTSIKIRRPFAIGAVIRIGRCLDLTTLQGIELIRLGYAGFKADWEQLNAPSEQPLKFPHNTEDHDMRGRYLDYQVINYTCQKYSERYKEPIHTVRSFFFEGAPAYHGAGFQEKTHTQICVRDAAHAILGFFRIPNLSELL